MSTAHCQWLSINRLNAPVALLCLLALTVALADDAPPVYAAPPVEQALVPEGVFALHLAKALIEPKSDAAVKTLKLDDADHSEDSNKAEALLSGLGIEPKNGWISDYPVTPAVLGDIEISVLAAAGQNKIALSKEQAQSRVGAVKTELGLTANPLQAPPAAPYLKAEHLPIYVYTDNKGVEHFTDVYSTIPGEYRGTARIINHSPQGGASQMGTAPVASLSPNPDPAMLNNYYDGQGPPVLTYYAPPDPYAYLYAWFPYPFWSSGYYFPGFFVLNNFRRTLYFNQKPYFVAHHGHAEGAHGQQLHAGGLSGAGNGGAGLFANPAAKAGALAIASLAKKQVYKAAGGMAGNVAARQGYGNITAVNAGATVHNGPVRPVMSSGGAYNNRRVYAPLTPPRIYTQAPEYTGYSRSFAGHSYGGGEGGRHGGGGGGRHR